MTFAMLSVYDLRHVERRIARGHHFRNTTIKFATPKIKTRKSS